MALRLVKTGARCPSSIEGETDAAGIVRFERMKTGPYQILIVDSQEASASAHVEDGKSTSVTLTKTP